MPFTLSHPAAVAALARRGLPLSALVIGSMAPDFPYFIHLSTRDHSGHTVSGIFLLCIPYGLLALWLFHNLLKFPLLLLLPISHQARLAPIAGGFRFGPGRNLTLIILSLLLGAVSHVVWDSFTHNRGMMVQQITLLQLPVLQTPWGVIRVFKLLQHGSTLAGGALLAYWYARWFRQAPVEPAHLPERVSEPVRIGLIIVMSVLALVTAVIFIIAKLSTLDYPMPVHSVISHTVVAGLTAAAIELVVFSLGWHAYVKMHDRRA
ncbi:MAG: DUF4184 family protein [bacterium]|nr:DUF4184 family protein [bacterium]